MSATGASGMSTMVADLKRLPSEDILERYVAPGVMAFLHPDSHAPAFKWGQTYQLGLYNDMVGEFNTSQWLDQDVGRS